MPAQDPGDQRTGDGDRPGETEAERDDRNLADLLQELRVAGLGIQVIFGYLLALPFTSKFSALGPGQRTLYVATLVLAAVATALLVGPVAYHRGVFRRHLKRHLVGAANVMAILGLATVGLTAPAATIGVFVVCLSPGLWFVYPLTRHWDSRPGPLGTPPDRPGAS